MAEWKFREGLPTVIVDHDDTLCPMRTLFVARINKYFGTEFDIDNLEFIQKDTYLNTEVRKKYGITDEHLAAFYKDYASRSLYTDVPLFPGARKAMEMFNEETNLFIGTSPIYPDMMEYAGDFAKYKYEHFGETLPFIQPTQIVIADCKRIIDAHVRIDDSKSQLMGAQLPYLFPAKHNANIPDEELQPSGIIRVNSWPELWLHYQENKHKIRVNRR